MHGLRHLRYTRKIAAFKDLFNGSGYITFSDAPINRVKYKQYMDAILPLLDNKDIRIRTESNTVNIFLNDYHLYKRLCTELDWCITNVFEPENDQIIDLLMGSKKIIVCKNYPHGLYKLKVTFKRLPPNIKEVFLTWQSTYSREEMMFPNASQKYLSSPVNHYWESCYMYIKDTKMFTLLSLVASGYIKKVEEYVIDSSINTVSQSNIHETVDG